MKRVMRKISLIWLIIVGFIILAWCHNPIKDLVDQIEWKSYSEVAQICKDSYGKLTTDELWNNICLFFEDEWCLLEKIQDWTCEWLNQEEDFQEGWWERITLVTDICEESAWQIDYIAYWDWICRFNEYERCYLNDIADWECEYLQEIDTSKFLKTSITSEQEFNEIAEAHFPKSYTYYIGDVRNQSAIYETWEFVYPEDHHHYHHMLIPELNWMVDAEIVDSNIDTARIDGKPAIFTNRIVYLEDGSKIHVEYFNDPETLNFDNMAVFYWGDDNRFKVYKFYY